LGSRQIGQLHPDLSEDSDVPSGGRDTSVRATGRRVRVDDGPSEAALVGLEGEDLLLGAAEELKRKGLWHDHERRPVGLAGLR
jgi:hypothetical protein